MDRHKEMSESTRRAKALATHGGDELAPGRSLQALANVTTDSETKKLARSDAEYFSRNTLAVHPKLFRHAAAIPGGKNALSY